MVSAGAHSLQHLVTAYDSLGNGREITVDFRRTGANRWGWHAMADGEELTGGTPGTPTVGASGTLTSTADGALDTETTTSSSGDFVGATPGQTIDFDFGDSITTDGRASGSRRKRAARRWSARPAAAAAARWSRGPSRGATRDLARELVDRIAYQRGFSANRRIVTTADEMYTELVSLKR